MFTLKYLAEIVIVLCAFFWASTHGKKYSGLLSTVSEENPYSSHHPTYHPVYSLKAAKEYIYRNFPVYVDYTPKVQGHVKIVETPKTSPSVQLVETPVETDYSAANIEYYPRAYTHATRPTPTPSYESASSGVSEVEHLSSVDTKEYKYGYRITNPHTGTEFGHSEVNDGHTAKGYYHVLLPDGRLQNVKYWAGESGFNAVVSYESNSGTL